MIAKKDSAKLRPSQFWDHCSSCALKSQAGSDTTNSNENALNQLRKVSDTEARGACHRCKVLLWNRWES